MDAALLLHSHEQVVSSDQEEHPPSREDAEARMMCFKSPNHEQVLKLGAPSTRTESKACGMLA